MRADLSEVRTLASAQLYDRVFFKARVLEPGEARSTTTGKAMRVAKLCDLEGRIAVIARIFGASAEGEVWNRGNIVVVKNASVRPDQRCVKVDQDAAVSLVESGRGSAPQKGCGVTPVNFAWPHGGSETGSEDDGEDSSDEVGYEQYGLGGLDAW